VAQLAALVLAAGEGTRMKSRHPKPLMPVCGKPMIMHILDQLELLGPERVLVVVGARREQVIAALAQRRVEFVVQEPQRGTGHAVQCAQGALEGWQGDLLVTCADVPLVRATTLQQLLDTHRQERAAATLLTALYPDPTGYGRVVRDAAGAIVGIVEERDADAAVRAIREVNVGVYVFQTPALLEALAHIEPSNVQGELYLTDVVAVMARQGLRIAAFQTDTPQEAMGINDRVQLARAEAWCRQQICQRLLRDGVTILDPTSTFIDADVLIGADTVIWPGVHILGRCIIGAGCTIGPHAYLVSSNLGEGCAVQVGAVISHSQIGAGCSLGPYCHLRDHTQLADDVRVGSYTEIVRSSLGPGTKALHFSYLGDAQIGARVNIGAGCVTCNFDGRQKHLTVIDSRAFVGSDVILVAPVHVGEGAYIAAGSVITEDVPAGALAIARSRQIVKPEWVRRRFGDQLSPNA
jgi:bifunctional UDP-N-acetylglucosamine pyrophosphorylase/glucosamine-1-phosphate N-acetyltransferase